MEFETSYEVGLLPAGKQYSIIGSSFLGTTDVTASALLLLDVLFLITSPNLMEERC